MRWKWCMLNAMALIALALCQTVIINSTDNTCTTHNGGDGVCVKYFHCDRKTKTVIDDGYTLIDVRAGECNELLKVCCALNRIRDQTEEPSDDMSPSDKEVVVEKQAPEEALLSNVPIVEKQRPAMTVPGKVPRIEIGTCGYSNPGAALFRERDGGDPDDRVYADYGEFPWMVAILNGTMAGQWDSMKYIGGGSLIHPSVVITTAHKITDGYKLRDLTVRAGEYDTNSEDEQYDAQERKVVKMLVHDNYDRAHVHNDVALLFLNRPVELLNEPHLGIGCLAPVPPQPGTTCFSMGWGIKNFGNKSVFAAILKKVKVPTLSANQCEQMLRRTWFGRKFNLHQSLLCAGGEKGVDTCTGDGGSSLVCRVESKGTRFAIYGMVAYGAGCGRQDVPGVYVNISNVYDWVKQQMVAEGLGTKSFDGVYHICQSLRTNKAVFGRTDNTCTTHDGDDGVCVKYFHCDRKTKTVIDDGYTLIDVRAGECNELLKVCCALNRIRDQTEEPSDDMSPSDKEVVVEKQAPEEALLSNVPIVEKQRPAMTVPGKVPRIEIGTCGYSNPGAALFRERDGGDPDDRVYADYGEFPWMVAILNGTMAGQWDSMKYIGGGSLIHPSVVITTAHKITDGYKLRDLTVRAGEYDTNSEDEQYDAQERKVVKMLVHDNYDQVPTSASKCCEGRGLVENSICINPCYAPGEKGVDTCTGDGGSSLVCRVESKGTRFAIYGMVAYGAGCGRQDVPGVYVNISNVYDWVKQQMVAEGLGTKSFDYI